MKKLIASILLFSLALSFSGCSGSPASSISSSIINSQSSSSESEFDPDDYTLAICMNSVTHPIHRVVQLGFIEAAQKLGYDNVIISGLDQGSLEELKNKWNADITEYGVDAVLLWTGDDSTVQLQKEWTERGIKVIGLYFPQEYWRMQSCTTANVTYDEYTRGVLAADVLVKTLQGKGIISGEIGFSQSSSEVYIKGCLAGFHDRVDEMDLDFTVLDGFGEGADSAVAVQQVEKYIAQNPSIVGGYGSTGGSALSWSSAAESLNRQDIVIVGTGYYTQNLELLENGKVTALISLPIYECAAKSVEVADALLRGAVYDTDEWQVIVDSQIITADGEGVNGIQYYLDLYTRSEAINWDDYMA